MVWARKRARRKANLTIEHTYARERFKKHTGEWQMDTWLNKTKEYRYKPTKSRVQCDEIPSVMS